MGRAFVPGDEEFLRLIRDLDRRLEALERNPSGQGSYGSRQIGTLPCARVFNSANITGILANAWTALPFNSERFDTDGIHDTATNNTRLVCRTAGVYALSGHVEWDSDVTGTFRGLAIISSTASFVGACYDGPMAVQLTQSIAAVWRMAVGEYVELAVNHNATTNRTINKAAQPYSPEFAMAWLSR